MIELDEYARKVGVSVSDMLSRSRTPELVAARQVYWFYLRSKGLGFSEIGRRFGWDHATVLYGVNRVRDLIWTKDGYLERYLDAAGYEKTVRWQDVREIEKTAGTQNLGTQNLETQYFASLQR